MSKNIDTSKSNVPASKIRKPHIIAKNIKQERLALKNELLSNVDLVFGIDNGSTGTIAGWVVKTNNIFFQETPSIKTLNYQQKITYIERINFNELKSWFEIILNTSKNILKNNNIKSLAVLERPMVNPQRFEMSLNAVRAFESCIIILEQLNINYIIIDSKNWQHYFFGKNTTLLNLKTASKKYGIEVLNNYKEINLNIIDEIIKIINKHNDADALLIAKYTVDKLLKNLNKKEKKC